MPKVVAIGSHPREFFTHLEAAHYAHVVLEKYSQDALKSEEPPAAVAVYGNDVGLESTAAILDLLNSNAVLLFFSPSLGLLRLIKSATGTVIDLPELEFAGGIPLIVYKLRNLENLFHFALLSGNDSKDNVTDADQSESLRYAVSVIEDCVSHAADVSVTDSNSLTPPPGTTWYKFTSISMSKKLEYPDSSTWTYRGIADWRVLVHNYVTNAIPNEDFKRNGGVVYTALAHSGSFNVEWVPGPSLAETTEVKSNSHALKSTLYARTILEDTNNLLQFDSQAPESWTQVGSDTYNYNISFTEDLFLFKDGGQSQYPHTIGYQKNYSLDRVKQKSVHSIPNSAGFDFESPDDPHTTAINGLTAFTSDLGKASLDFSVAFRNYSLEKLQTLKLDLTFPQ